MELKDDLLTPKDIEREFGISLQTQARMRMKSNRKEGSIPFIKIGKKIFYKKISIKEWMDDLEIKK